MRLIYRFNDTEGRLAARMIMLPFWCYDHDEEQWLRVALYSLYGGKWQLRCVMESST